MAKTRFFAALAAIVPLVLCAAAGPCRAEPPAANVKHNPLVLARLERFQDWKFGLMMHWGIYSQWGCIESWPLVEVDKLGPARRPAALAGARQGFRPLRRATTGALNTTFHPRQFDPQQWAAAAKAAGMKYVVFTTKHHDGFCMFDTRQTDYRTTHASCPFHADPRADVVQGRLRCLPQGRASASAPTTPSPTGTTPAIGPPTGRTATAT